MTKSSSTSSSFDSLTKKELQLLKKLNEKYEKARIGTEEISSGIKFGMEKDLIEEHNRELDEVIKHGRAVAAHTQSLIKSMEKVKSVNEKRLATLKVKATSYTPTSEKPKRVKHTAGRHRVHGRKPRRKLRMLVM
ncbi:hypothetical protein JCGZ_03851 [Jatropha curcas]|uniref:Uncharacterized protein n=1 Tax=Jatropha curcas TaxID=180498 RepID=A0A067KW55_JATCU|nr:hypothetical protein JCGZ_03851 [Jatropha curcas]